jgi:chemotaxis protein histidine kinase CheA/ActR/RegA family two-component response regulator
MAGKSDSGDARGEDVPSPTAGEAEMLRNLFLEEAQKHLDRIADAQRLLARASENSLDISPEVVDVLFRHLHTLKGSAGSVGFDGVARAADVLEELCTEIRRGQLAPTFGILERIDEGVAEIRALLSSFRLTVPPARSGEPPDGAALPRETLERRRGVDPRAVVILRTRLDRRVHEMQSVLRDLVNAKNRLRSVQSALGGELPVPARMDEVARLLDRLSEVDVEFADALSYLDRTSRKLAEDAVSMRGTSEHIEEQIRRARLVPLEWAFSRLGSALHELERTCHRQADLTVQGGEVELDKAILDQLADPLLHLLRNAMAHGIEPAQVRAERGKPPRGRISIRASLESDFVFLTFEDDGGGIDREAIRRALQSSGQLARDASVSDEALVGAIFEAGFSTRLQSDSLAGRGMGMNIVKRAVVRMGGEIKVESQPGAFTRFRLSLPVAGAITQGLLFKVGGQVYAVPSAHVIEVLPIGHNVLAGNVRAASDSGELPALAGVSIPILKLHSLLGLELPPGRRAAALHVRYAGRNFLITCDKVIGPRTIVVRPPGPLLGLLPIYAGVTASGAGKAQLVLDLGALADLAYAGSAPSAGGPRRGQPRVLVVDDSRLAREAAGRLLASAGYQSVTVEDGWEAWEMLGERRFDAVVTALGMPRLDGFQLISRIRGEATLRGLPIIVLSSRTSQAVRARALAAGANAFLPKSRHRKSLVDAVAACLRDRGETAGRSGAP